MAKNRFETIFSVIGQDLASPAFAKVRTGLGLMGRSSKSATAQLRGTGNAMQQYFLARDIAGGFMRLGKSILGMFGAATDSAGKFEYGLASVGAVTRATSAELRMLERAGIEAGIATQFSPTEAVDGLRSLATAGQTATQATKTLVPVLDLAAGSMGQLGVEGAAEAVVGTLNAYTMSTDKAAGVTDKLLRITQLTNFQTRDFSLGLSKAAAMGANFDQSLTDVLIGMGQLRNRNIDASTSATSLREAFRRMGSDAGAQQAILKQGVKIFDETTNTMRSTLDIIAELEQATKDMGVAEKKALMVKVLGTRGQLAWNATIGAQATIQRDGREVVLKGAEAIAHLRKEMNNATGTAEEFRKKLLDTYEGQKTLLRGTMETIAIVAGKAFAGLFAPAVKFVTDAINKLIKFVDVLPDSVKKMTAALTIATGVIITLTGAIVMVNVVMKMFGIRLRDIGWMLLKTLAFMGPLVVVLGTLGVAIYGIYRHFSKATGAGNDFSSMVDGAKVAFGGLIDLIGSGSLSAETIKELDRIDSQGVRKFLDTANSWINNFKAFFNGVVDGFDQGLMRLEGPWNRLKETIVDIFGIWTGGAEKGTRSVNKWSDRGQAFGDVLSGLSVTMLELTNEFLVRASKIATAFDGISFETFVSSLRIIADLAGGILSIFEGLGLFFEWIGEKAAALVLTMQTLWEMSPTAWLFSDTAYGGSTSKAGSDIGNRFTSGISQLGKIFGGDFTNETAENEKKAANRKAAPLIERASDIKKQIKEIRDPSDYGGQVVPGAENRLIAEFEKLRKELEKQGKKIQPINVELDGKKVLQVLTRRGEDDDESNLGYDNIDDTAF